MNNDNINVFRSLGELKYERNNTFRSVYEQRQEDCSRFKNLLSYFIVSAIHGSRVVFLLKSSLFTSQNDSKYNSRNTKKNEKKKLTYLLLGDVVLARWITLW